MTNIEHKMTTISTYVAIMLVLTNSINKIFILGFFIMLFASTFPDWDLKFFGSGSSPEGFINIWGHRGIMHYYKTYLFAYLLILVYFLILSLFYGGISPIWFFSVSCFIFGCFAHILEDSVTTVGIPVYKVIYNEKGKWKKVYKPFSFKVGNFDSIGVEGIAWGITILNIAISILMFHIKFITVSWNGGYHA